MIDNEIELLKEFIGRLEVLEEDQEMNIIISLMLNAAVRRSLNYYEVISAVVNMFKNFELNQEVIRIPTDRPN